MYLTDLHQAPTMGQLLLAYLPFVNAYITYTLLLNMCFTIRRENHA